MSSVHRKRARIAGLTVVAAGAAGFILPGCSDDPPERTPAAARTEAPGQEAPGEAAAGAEVAGADLEEFRHDQAGFALSYPKGWVRPQSSDPQVVLIAAENEPAENRGGSILARVSALEAPVGREQLAEVRTVTDAIVRLGNNVEVKTDPTEIDQAGVPGLYYLYTFEDPVSRQRGAHSHYFLFHGKTMVSLVFQALPAEDFSRLAPLLDRVAHSFRILS